MLVAKFDSLPSIDWVKAPNSTVSEDLDYLASSMISIETAHPAFYLEIHKPTIDRSSLTICGNVSELKKTHINNSSSWSRRFSRWSYWMTCSSPLFTLVLQLRFQFHRHHLCVFVSLNHDPGSIRTETSLLPSWFGSIPIWGRNPLT
jgi:hypothetical protein